MKKTIKRILVPLDPSMYADAATRTACQIAKAHDAEITGVVILDSYEITSSLVPAIGPYYPMMIDAVQDRKEHAGHVLEDCIKRFAETCSKEGVRHTESQWEGIPAKKLLDSSIFYDLVVIGLETFFHFETRGKKGDKGHSLSELLDHTVTPVLAVPAAGMEKFDRALIAFDGSLASGAALQDFARFAQPFNFEVTVFTGDEPKQKADFLLQNAESYLRTHEFQNISLRHDPQPIEDCLEQEELDTFDVIIAGIHSKRVVKDYFVGSFTKSLIDNGTRPLFLSH